MGTGFSAQNSGNRPVTRQVGGGNGFSDAFERNNENYMHANDWRNTDRTPSDDGYRVDARVGASMPGTGPGTGNTSIPMGRGFGGLNYYNALQNRNLPAFRQPNQGTPWGMGNSAQEAGANMTQGGNLLRADGTYVPDTMYNRTLGSMNPYGGNQAQPQAPQGPNEDQQRWADANAKPQIGAGQTVQEMGQFAQKLPFMGGLGRGMEGYGKQLSSVEPQASSGGGNFSRASLIEGARKSGDFDKVMSDYNAKARAAGTGMEMDRNGSIVPLSKVADAQGTSPFARDKFGAGAEDIRARRDFNRGEAMDKSVSNGVGTLTKINPYGSASATYGGKPTGPGMMPDPLTGKMVPMRQWAADQSAVQATKYGPDAAQAGEDYFNKNAIAKDIASKMPVATKVAPTRSAVATPNMNPYSRLSTAMTGDAGTIKTAPTQFAPKLNSSGMPPAPNYSGVTTDYSGIRKGIATMNGNRPTLDTIKSAVPFGIKEPLNADKGKKLLKKTLGQF